MKRIIRVSYNAKRTYNLGNYENLVPSYTATEEIELGEGEEFTDDDYLKAYMKLKLIIRKELQEEAKRVAMATNGSAKDLATEGQFSAILRIARNVGADAAKGHMTLNDLVSELYPDTHPLSLTYDQAQNFINHYTNVTEN